jgi:hypothetical protein
MMDYGSRADFLHLAGLSREQHGAQFVDRRKKICRRQFLLDTRIAIAKLALDDMPGFGPRPSRPLRSTAACAAGKG